MNSEIILGYGGGSEPIKIGTPFIIGSIEVSGTVYPVYRKIVDCGALPNATYNDVPANINPNGVLQLFGIATRNGAVLPLPYIDNGNASVKLQINSLNNIRLTTFQDMSTYNALVTIDYY